MTRRVGIVTGISGVGKTSLLKKVATAIPMQVLSASSLIRNSLAQTEEQNTPQDRLCARDIDDNQAAMLKAFKRYANPDTILIVLDAHVVVDTPNGLTRVGSDVFREINADFVVFVKDEPRKIHTNRERDGSRSRPKRSVESLAKYQDIAIAAARDLSKDLSIPIYFVDGGDGNALSEILKNIQEIGPDV
ncbi:MAG: AAA family ATPase [Paracoccus sp. (in: a-proteobacteria)]|uniref:AAA family ATPase n=1 Tax=Rhodobacterales TaxID=204455 RepID=UPI004058730E